jgi:uncharacterized protein
MNYEDRVYGPCTIEEPVILELINSPCMQRLKEIDQGGYRPLWVKPEVTCGQYDHSRFAHSVGVFLLLRTYRAPLEEQIAGLLHDVSHSAFSHCIDYVFDESCQKKHNHQDAIFESYVKKSEIPSILKKHGFTLDDILDDSHFPLKEKTLPDLCADRIDYSLRTAVIFEEMTSHEVKTLLHHLTVEEKKWVFTTFEYAKQYAELFLRLNRVHFSGFSSAVMFSSVGECLKYACHKSYITKDDLYTTDTAVLTKLKRHIGEDEKFDTLWLRMNNKIQAFNSQDGDATEVFCKSRMVDPLFKDPQGPLRVSEKDSSWIKIIKEELQPRRYFISYSKDKAKKIGKTR